VAAGGDGTVYFSGLAADISTDPPTTAVVASRSRNGGRTWRRPATVAAPLQGNETDSVTASSTRAGHAYVAWANFIVPSLPRANTVEFSRTSDRDATWSPPVLVDQPGRFQIDQSPRILVLPDGTLLAVFARADLQTGLGTLHAAWSLDEGRSWLPAVQAGAKPIPQDLVDQETGIPLPQPGFPSAAVAPDGTVYIAFEDSTSATSGAIGVLRSRDGGRTWTSTTLPGVHGFAFEPAIAVDAHGTVGVTWYDLRNDRPGDAALTAGVWFAHSHDRDRSWGQIHVAGPTDLRTAPLPAHNYVGEYQGLAGLPAGAASPRSSPWPRRRRRTGRPTSSSLGSSQADRHTTIAPARQSSTSRHLGMVSAAQKPQDIVLEPVFVGPILSDDGDSALRRHWRRAAIAAAGAREWSWPPVGVPAPLPGLSANARSTSASR
jgi:hypothetical protein